MLATARKDFPRSLATVPVLLPTSHAAVRARLDHWFEQLGVRPRIVGEFEDSALLKTFGASGMGVFPAAEWAHEDLLAHEAVQRLGTCEGVTDHFFAIGTERKVQHPLVQLILQAAL
jgi:LysR family transcriptional activator of nhaA